MSGRNQGNGGWQNKPTAAKVTFDDKNVTEESSTTKARPLWRDDHHTVPDGPGWVFSTTDGQGWNQDAFKPALTNAMKNKEGEKNIKRERTDADEPKAAATGIREPVACKASLRPRRQ